MKEPDPFPHTCDFGEHKELVVGMCREEYCTEMRVGTKDGWRELTPHEKTEVTILMWEDIIIAQSMQIIHGKERGIAVARRHLGYPEVQS